MARGRAPPRPRLRAVPGHPSPLPLRRCACSGQGAVCRGPSAPCARASARWPGSAVRSAAAPGPPSLRGFACRLRRHRCAVSVPAPARWLGLSAPAAARPSAAAPGPPPPRCASACGLRRLGAPALAPVAAVALACCGWASGPPSAVCGLPVFPWAVPGGGAPRVGPSRRLPSLVPRSVGGLVGLRAPGLPPGPPAGLRPAFFGPPARAWGRCWRSVGFGVFRACGRGDSAACGRRARGPAEFLDVLASAFGLALAVAGRGARSLSRCNQGNIPPWGIVDSTRRRKNQPFLLEISRNVVHFADCRRRRFRGTLIVQRTGARRSA